MRTFSKLSFGLLFFAITALSSCSTNSNDQPEPVQAFFNLNVGNQWVYKQYENTNQEPDVYNFNGKIDSVKVVSEVEINGIQYAKLSHKVNNSIPKYEYLRVDELGHLVGSNFLYSEGILPPANDLNVLKHPGNDTAYQSTVVKETGTTYLNVATDKDIDVEDNTYRVRPLVIQHKTPSEYPPVITKTVEINYKKQVGLVKKTNTYASDTPFYWEDRLVWYHIVN